MEYYELFYIIPSKYTEAEVVDIMKKVEAMVSKHGGKVKRHEDGGKLKFAYPISHVRFGNYILMEFEAEKTAPKAIEHDLRLSLTNEVLRFTLQKMPEVTRGKALKLSTYIAPLSEEAESARATPSSRPRPAAPVKAVSEEELEKKIDEALSEDAAKL